MPSQMESNQLPPAQGRAASTASEHDGFSVNFMLERVADVPVTASVSPANPFAVIVHGREGAALAIALNLILQQLRAGRNVVLWTDDPEVFAQRECLTLTRRFADSFALLFGDRQADLVASVGDAGRLPLVVCFSTGSNSAYTIERIARLSCGRAGFLLAAQEFAFLPLAFIQNSAFYLLGSLNKIDRKNTTINLSPAQQVLLSQMHEFQNKPDGILSFFYSKTEGSGIAKMRGDSLFKT